MNIIERQWGRGLAGPLSLFLCFCFKIGAEINVIISILYAKITERSWTVYVFG